MSYEVPRSLVEAYYAVFATRDADKLAQYLHDDIEWTISGPVDYLAFCGTHRGKAAVIDLIKRQIPLVLRTHSFASEAVVVEGDQAAMLSRQSWRRTADDRAVSYRVANFVRFRDGKVIENISLIDTFDAVEQILGRPLDVRDAARIGKDGIVAV
jgi:ketosteroid isomerase-like protein